MKIDVTLNIIDVVVLVMEEMERRMPGCEVTGLTVKSWNRVLLQVCHGTLVEPVRHHLNVEHAELMTHQKITPLRGRGNQESKPGESATAMDRHSV